jgi:phage tail-like protein
MFEPFTTTAKAVTNQVGKNFLPTADPTVRPLGLAMRFTVEVNGVDLGRWMSCKGLQADFKPQRFREQGNPSFDKILFGEVSYPPIKLERAMSKVDSGLLQTWLRTELRSWLVSETTYAGGGASITLLDTAGEPVYTWKLRGVYPSAWIGPSLVANQSAVAIETLELAHEGFL